MDTFLLADCRKNINVWDIPVLYGDAAEILIADAERDFVEDRPATHSFSPFDRRSVFELPSAKRDSLPVIHVQGSFYEIGYKIGRTFSSMIREFIETHPEIALYTKLYETAKGKQVYDSCYDAVSRFYPEYMRELEGMAAGVGLPFYKVFLLHMEDIMLVALPRDEDKPVPYRGSTTLVATDQNHQLMGHVVDANAVALTNLYVVKAIITECCPPQEFTALCIGGMLPGNSISFNANGMVFAVDPVPVRKCNECGVPRSIVCRDLLSIHDGVKVGSILKCDGPGIGNGVSVTCTQMGVQLAVRPFMNYEAAPRYPAHSRSSVSRHEVAPPKATYFYHLNKFHKLTMVQEIVQSTYTNWILSKKNVLSKYENQFGQKMSTILGENSIHSTELKNVYTSAVSSCGMVSVAVGIFDCLEETLAIYLDNPSETNPIIASMPLSTRAKKKLHNGRAFLEEL